MWVGQGNGGLQSSPEITLDLAVRALVPPGAPAIVERPAYYGAINALRGAHACILEVPVDSDGMNLEVLRAHLSR